MMILLKLIPSVLFEMIGCISLIMARFPRSVNNLCHPMFGEASRFAIAKRKAPAFHV